MNFWEIGGGVLLALLVLAVLALIMVYKKQCLLDAPFKGIFFVEHQGEGLQPLVWFQAAENPELFKDGDIIKLKVRVVKDISQEKQRS